MTLTVRERAILDFERSWWLEASESGGTTKQDAIRRELSMSPTRFYALLEQLVDSPEAAEYDPLVIARLRRRRDARRRAMFTSAELPGKRRPR